MDRAKHVIAVNNEELVLVAEDFRDAGYRLVQISCEKEQSLINLHYTFEKDPIVVELCLAVVPDEAVPSITPHFPDAFPYESGIHEHCGIVFHGNDADFKGLLYKLSGPGFPGRLKR